jgi:hypothetical protein
MSHDALGNGVRLLRDCHPIKSSNKIRPIIILSSYGTVEIEFVEFCGEAIRNDVG